MARQTSAVWPAVSEMPSPARRAARSGIDGGPPAREALRPGSTNSRRSVRRQRRGSGGPAARRAARWRPIAPTTPGRPTAGGPRPGDRPCRASLNRRRRSVSRSRVELDGLGGDDLGQRRRVELEASDDGETEGARARTVLAQDERRRPSEAIPDLGQLAADEATECRVQLGRGQEVAVTGRAGAGCM